MREKLQKPMLKFTSPNPQRDKTRLINHIKKERQNLMFLTRIQERSVQTV